VSEWMTIDPGCGVTIATRTRSIVAAPAGSGSACPTLMDTIMYSAYECPSVEFALNADFFSLITDDAAYAAFALETTNYLADSLGVSPDDIEIDSISPGSIVINFRIKNPS
jgi:hypothetical protein